MRDHLVLILGASAGSQTLYVASDRCGIRKMRVSALLNKFLILFLSPANAVTSESAAVGIACMQIIHGHL